MGDQSPLGTKNLWNTPGVSLPGPFRSLVRHLRANGIEGSRAYQVAWSQARKWAAAGKARWVKVVAQLEAARAKAKATPNKTSHSVTGDALALTSLPGDPMATCPSCSAPLALAAVPPQFLKNKGKKTPPATKTPATAKSTVQVPEGQEAQFKALAARIAKRPGMTQEKAEKAAAAILRNRKGAKAS